MADDILLQALANQQKEFQQNNMWNSGGDALQAMSMGIAKTPDENNPNDSLIAALVTGLGSGLARGYGQYQNRQQMADYSSKLNQFADDYSAGKDISGYADSPYSSFSTLVPAMTLQRAQAQREMQQKLDFEKQKNTLDFMNSQRGNGFDVVGADEYGNPIYKANTSRAQAMAELELPKQALDLSTYKEKKLIDTGITSPIEAKKDIVANEDKLRAEVFQRSGIDNLRTIDQVYNSMIKSYPDTTGQSDIDFIIGAAKSVDPSSVVRSSEGDQIINTGGSTGYLQGILGWIKGGNKLTPETKQGLIKLVGQRRDEALNSYNNVLKETATVAQNRGASMNNIDVLGHYAPSAEVVNLYQPQRKPGTDPFTPYDPSMFNRGQAPQQAPQMAPSSPNMGGQAPQIQMPQAPIKAPPGQKAQMNPRTGEVRFVPK